MKNNFKKVIGIVCALAISSIMASVSVSAFELPEADEAFAAINNPSTTKEDFEFMVATYQAQGLLGNVVYDLLSNSDADPDSMFFKLANKALDTPTAAILGEEEAVAADEVTGEPAAEEAEVVSTVVTSHTYAFDSEVGIASPTADEALYGKSASVLQSIKCGTKQISSILWSFVLPEEDNNIEFAVEATSNGTPSNEAVKKTFTLPSIESNGTVTIGIVLNNWAADTRVINNPEFITTTFGYAEEAAPATGEGSEATVEPVAEEAAEATEEVVEETTEVVEEAAEAVEEAVTEIEE